MNKEGEALPPLRALNQHGVLSDVIFLRADGWSLGAPTDLVSRAQETWPEQWVAVINVQTKDWRVYDDDWANVVSR